MLISEPREYVADVLRLLLSLENEWIVFPRYGGVDDFIKAPSLTNAYAAKMSPDKFEDLIDVMVTIQKNHTAIENDPYLLASSGEIIAVWDHHVFSGGFGVSFSDVKKSTLYISALNELGVEFDVIYSNED